MNNQNETGGGRLLEELKRTVVGSTGGSALRGSITASCGHELADDEGEHGCGFDTITLSDGCDFDGVYRSALYGSACRKCYDEMAKQNMLATREEAERWINTGELPARMKCEKPNVPGQTRSAQNTNQQ